MIHRRDRFELGLLSLALVTWALAVAPVIHTFAHAHGDRHEHAGSSKSHGDGSFEHQRVVMSTPMAAPELQLVVVASRLPERASPRAPFFERRHSTEMSQGP